MNENEKKTMPDEPLERRAEMLLWQVQTSHQPVKLKRRAPITGNRLPSSLRRRQSLRFCTVGIMRLRPRRTVEARQKDAAAEL